MHAILKWIQKKKAAGQAFVELALLIPILLIMLTGMVEIAFVMYQYMTAVDLTREAARFASIRDYNITLLDNYDTSGAFYVMTTTVTGMVGWFDPRGSTNIVTPCMDKSLHYFYDAACFFTDPSLNPSINFRADKYDDVVITVFTVSGNLVSDRHPSSPGYFSLNNNNWQKDCDGNVTTTTPYFSNAYIESQFLANAPTDKGLVAVELYVCNHLILDLPIVSQFLPNPYRLHVYTVMPAPEALPTPTPIMPTVPATEPPS
jgi:hypothetical protein